MGFPGVPLALSEFRDCELCTPGVLVLGGELRTSTAREDLTHNLLSRGLESHKGSEERVLWDRRPRDDVTFLCNWVPPTLGELSTDSSRMLLVLRRRPGGSGSRSAFSTPSSSSSS